MITKLEYMKRIGRVLELIRNAPVPPDELINMIEKILTGNM